MVDIPALSALIKEPGLCARSSHVAPEPTSNTSKSQEQLALTIYSVLHLFISATDGS